MKTGIESELKPQVIPEEHTCIEVVRQRSSIGATTQTARLLVALQILMTALFETGLRFAILIEKTDDIRKQFTLGIDPMGIRLEINTADAFCPDRGGSLRIEALHQLDPGWAITHALQDLLL